MGTKVTHWFEKHWPSPWTPEGRGIIVRQVRIATVVVYVWMLILSVAAIVAFSAVTDARNKAHADTQQSRFTAAYLLCIGENNSHVKALEDARSFNPKTQGGGKALVAELVQDLQPLRAAGYPPFPPFPKHIPKSWVEGCTKFAQQQISIDRSVPIYVPIAKENNN